MLNKIESGKWRVVANSHNYITCISSSKTHNKGKLSQNSSMKSHKKDESTLAPLLPKLHSLQDINSNSASISGAVFNVSTSMIGAGIMSIPATLKVLGIIPGFIMILLMAYLVQVTVNFLLRYTRSGQSATYGGLMAESFGKFGSIALQISVLVSNLGALIIYLIIIGKLLLFL